MSAASVGTLCRVATITTMSQENPTPRSELEKEVLNFIEVWEDCDDDIKDTVLTCFLEEAWPTQKAQNN